MSEPRVGSTPPSTDVSFLGIGNALQYDMLMFTSTPHHGMVGVIQCKTKPEEQQESESRAELMSRVSFEEIEPFVRRSILSSFGQPTERLRGAQATFQYRALTNWLRSVADNEPSRPIFPIDEVQMLPVEPQQRAPVTVSPSLRRDAPATQVGGLGHVRAGLLLWLESTEMNDEDA